MSLLAASFQSLLLAWIGADERVALILGAAALLMVPLPWVLGDVGRRGFAGLAQALVRACVWWLCFELAAIALLMEFRALLRLAAVPSAWALPLLPTTTVLLSTLAPAATGALMASCLRGSPP